MLKKGDANDPKGLIFEAYRIEGITKAECRTIFLDWALSLPVEKDQTRALQSLYEAHRTAHADHPMTDVLAEGLVATDGPKRRGGWRGRSRPSA